MAESKKVRGSAPAHNNSMLTIEQVAREATQHGLFHQAQDQMLTDFRAWLRTSPPREQVIAEIEKTWRQLELMNSYARRNR